TLATPFLQLFPTESPALVKLAKRLAMLWVFGCIAAALLLTEVLVEHPSFVTALLVIPLSLLVVATVVMLAVMLADGTAAAALAEASEYDANRRAPSELLVLRGIDDEAALSLAAGAIGVRLSRLLLGVIAAPSWLYLCTPLPFFLFYAATLGKWTDRAAELI